MTAARSTTDVAGHGYADRDLPRPLSGARRTAWLMMAAIAVSWLDRALPGILIEPMRLDLGLTDTQVSLLTGLSFSLCYGVLAYPLGALVDRANRVLVLVASVACWCSMTVAFGLVDGFWLLFACRMGVGIGEAALVPAGLSLLSDLFPRWMLPRALALMSIGSPIGIMLALVGGSMLFQWLETSGVAAWIGLPAWRLTFVAAGAVGLILAPMLWLAREPRRVGAVSVRDRATLADAAPAGPFAYIRGSVGFFAPLLLGIALFNLYVAGYLSWMAPYFQRSFGWSLTRTGALAGLSVVLTGLVGNMAGGWATARLGGRGRDAAMRVVSGASVLIAPMAILGPLATNGWVAYGIVVAQLLLTFAAATALQAAIVNGTPARLRGRLTATTVFLGAVVGGALGPTAFALLTDHVFGEPALLRWSLTLGSALIFAPLLPLFLAASRAYPAAIDRADRFGATAGGADSRKAGVPTDHRARHPA